MVAGHLAFKMGSSDWRRGTCDWRAKIRIIINKSQSRGQVKFFGGSVYSLGNWQFQGQYTYLVRGILTMAENRDRFI